MEQIKRKSTKQSLFKAFSTTNASADDESGKEMGRM